MPVLLISNFGQTFVYMFDIVMVLFRSTFVLEKNMLQLKDFKTIDYSIMFISDTSEVAQIMILYYGFKYRTWIFQRTPLPPLWHLTLTWNSNTVISGALKFPTRKANIQQNPRQNRSCCLICNLFKDGHKDRQTNCNRNNPKKITWKYDIESCKCKNYIWPVDIAPWIKSAFSWEWRIFFFKKSISSVLCDTGHNSSLCVSKILRTRHLLCLGLKEMAFKSKM